MNRLITALLLLLPFGAFAADHVVQQRAGVSWMADTEYTVENLAGEVTVSSSDGDQVIVQVSVVGESEELAESVTLRQDGSSFWLEYPTDQYDTFVYRGRRGSGNTTTTYRGERVTVTGRGRGPQLHADVHITVPHGAKLSVVNSVGTVGVADTHADLTLRTGSGRINAAQTRGHLGISSGSGAVTVAGHDGPVELRTGSGRIRAEQLSGGAVSLRTGSGGVNVEGVQGDLTVRTGSGSVRVGDLGGSRALHVSTGSGSVRVDGDLSGVTDLRVTTGSGSVRIETSGVPDVQLVARAGSGSVSVDLDGMSKVSTARNRVTATLGSGQGEGLITTGSGSISVRSR